MKICVNGEIAEIRTGGGASKDVYSTEEQVVGRWIDGKPLYRRCVHFTTAKRAGSGANVYWESTGIMLPYVDVLVTAIPIIDSLPDHYKSAGLSRVDLAVHEGKLVTCSEYHSTLLNVPGIALLEYTKTTDQATVELPAMLAAQPATALSADSSVTEAMASDAAVASQI